MCGFSRIENYINIPNIIKFMYYYQSVGVGVAGIWKEDRSTSENSCDMRTNLRSTGELGMFKPP